MTEPTTAADTLAEALATTGIGYVARWKRPANIGTAMRLLAALSRPICTDPLHAELRDALANLVELYAEEPQWDEVQAARALLKGQDE